MTEYQIPDIPSDWEAQTDDEAWLADKLKASNAELERLRTQAQAPETAAVEQQVATPAVDESALRQQVAEAKSYEDLNAVLAGAAAPSRLTTEQVVAQRQAGMTEALQADSKESFYAALERSGNAGSQLR
ncbi:hypothetical protein [Jiangella sp. DSM 45060]|uniref:hypothetical protein n=1 Tax=Jiangella sp. DSM 45060 TaxID=1798224 RepID=UPI0012FD8E83|nr:hypothetical protein [Jiangella sp. DSM 45060]